MAKLAPQDVLDAALDAISTANAMVLCSAQPSTYEQAVSTYALAEAAMSGGDFTKANGDVSGRKLIIAAKSNVSVAASGDGEFVVLVNKSNETIRYINECPRQTVTEGNTVSFQSWKIEFQQPAS